MTTTTRLQRIGFLLLVMVAFSISVPSIGSCASGGFLWVGLYDNDSCNGPDDSCAGIVQVSPSGLKKSGSPKTLGVSSFDEVDGQAFDAKHNLWALVSDDNSAALELVEFTAAQLKALKSKSNPTPAVVITSSAFDGPDGINFDHGGNLWVADCNSDSVYEFSVAQLTSGGSKTPAVTNNSSDLHCPEFITFDSGGNAWTSNNSNSTLSMFTPGQLTGNQNPGVVLTGDGHNSMNNPGQIAFDPKGNLWLANYTGGNVVGFAKSDITSSGGPTPFATLTSDNNDSIDGPWGLAFVGANLTIGNYHTGTISYFVASQLKTSGSPTPKAKISPGSIDISDINQFTVGPAN